MSISRRGFIVAGGAGAACVALGCAQAPSKSEGDRETQPFWIVRKGVAKVYIYGGFGSVMPKWSAPRVEAAFDEARVFWTETADLLPGDEQKFIAPGLAGNRPLSMWLTPEQKDIVASAAVEAGTTYDALERLKPWLAGISINRAYNSRPTEKAAEDPIPILAARAKAQGKVMRAEFPDAESQLKMLLGMSDAAQVEYLLYTIENNRLSLEVVNRRRRAWASGDLSLEVRQVEHFKADFPNLYEIFELQRNRAWPARIKQMLDEGETAFVLVGADHLAGPDNMLLQLERAGMMAERI